MRLHIRSRSGRPPTDARDRTPAGRRLSRDGTRWIACHEGFFLPVKVLSALFRGKFLALLDEAAWRGQMRFAGSTAALAEPTAWAAFLTTMRREAWVVYAKPPFGSPERGLKYLARYTHRVAISNRRIAAVTDAHVAFRYRDRQHGDVTRTMTLGGGEFLRRFLLHVLPQGFVRIRHFGLFANRLRQRRLARCRALLGAPGPAAACPPVLPPAAPSATDAEVHDERETRRCPRCGIGRLRGVGRLPPTVEGSPTRDPLHPPDTS